MSETGSHPQPGHPTHADEDPPPPVVAVSIVRDSRDPREAPIAVMVTVAEQAWIDQARVTYQAR